MNSKQIAEDFLKITYIYYSQSLFDRNYSSNLFPDEGGGDDMTRLPLYSLKKLINLKKVAQIPSKLLFFGELCFPLFLSAKKRVFFGDGKNSTKNKMHNCTSRS